MKAKNVLTLFSAFIFFAAFGKTALAGTESLGSNGLFHAVSGAKVDIKILQAHVYSVNNANTDFSARLDTSAVVNSAVLRIDGHEYSCSGWAAAQMTMSCGLPFMAKAKQRRQPNGFPSTVICGLHRVTNCLRNLFPQRQNLAPTSPSQSSFNLKIWMNEQFFFNAADNSAVTGTINTDFGRSFQTKRFGDKPCPTSEIR